MPRVSPDHLQARRRQILDGARAAFARHGYEGATVRVLEEEIGLSRGAIFHHFPDKDALFFALAAEDFAAMASVATREGLVQAMRDMVAAPDRGWLGTALEVSRRVRTDPDFRATWERRAAEITRATRERLIRQREAGVLRDDVDIDVLVTYLEVVREGLVAHLAADRPAEHLAGVLDLVEFSVRRHP